MKERGFTLIELLIVVAIIAILAAIAVPNFLEAQTRSKVSRSKSDMRTIAVALEAYYVDNNRYIQSWPDGYTAQPIGPNTAPAQFPLRLEVNGRNYYHPYGSVGNRLTSPVAYLTSIPNDIFCQTMKRDVVGDVSFASVWYSCWNNSGPGLATKPIIFPVQGGKNYAPLWFLRSVGPKLTFNTDAYYVYDPTNGTISKGEIYYLSGDRFLDGK